MTDLASADLSMLQRKRKWQLVLSGILLLVFMLFFAPISPPEAFAHEAIEAAGFALIGVCIMGRTWCALYIGGKKRREIVSTGPYSIMRNPLYSFSLLGAAGVGMATGSVVIGAVTTTCAYLVFRSIVMAEEVFLSRSFGVEYDQYCKRVPRWPPRLAVWRDVPEISVHPKMVLTTFRDACFFLIAVPFFEKIDQLQVTGLLPVLFHVF